MFVEYLCKRSPKIKKKYQNYSSILAIVNHRNKLKFDAHIKHVCKKLSQICNIFCYLRHYICKKTLLMLYYSSVNSHILYGILVWGSTNHSILQPLQVLQNKILRIICNVSKNEHVRNNSLYHELKLLKVKDMYHFEMAKFMYLFQHDKLPLLLKQYTSTSQDALVTATFIYIL